MQDGALGLESFNDGKAGFDVRLEAFADDLNLVIGSSRVLGSLEQASNSVRQSFVGTKVWQNAWKTRMGWFKGKTVDETQDTTNHNQPKEDTTIQSKHHASQSNLFLKK